MHPISKNSEKYWKLKCIENGCYVAICSPLQQNSSYCDYFNATSGFTSNTRAQRPCDIYITERHEFTKFSGSVHILYGFPTSEWAWLCQALSRCLYEQNSIVNSVSVDSSQPN